MNRNFDVISDNMVGSNTDAWGYGSIASGFATPQSESIHTWKFNYGIELFLRLILC